jgi:hypothetical protein
VAYHVFRKYVGGVQTAYAHCRDVVEYNCRWLAKHPELPNLIDCDFVTYFSDPKGFDTYYTIPQIIERGGDDCEGFAAWLVAEDIVRRGFDARVIFYRRKRWKRGKHHAVALRKGPPLDYKPYVRFKLRGGLYAIDPCMPKGMHEYLLRQREMKSCLYR